MTISTSKTSYFDIVISGGGLSGLLTAIGLQQECPHLSVAIIEPHSNTEKTAEVAIAQLDNFDGRCIALSYGTLRLLELWSVWSKLKPMAWPIKTIVTSDKGHIGKTILKANDFDLNAMGYVAEMRNIGQVFKQCVDENEGAPKNHQSTLTWFHHVEIERHSTSNDDQSSEILLSDGRQLQAKLLIVAEGGRSATKQRLGIENEAEDYKQTAIVTNIKTRGGDAKLTKLLRRPKPSETDPHKKSHAKQNQIDIALAHTVAFERFTTHGPIALLPIGEQQYSLVWTESPQKAQQLLALSDELFCAELQQEFGFAAGQFTAVSERSSFPLYLAKSNDLVHNRVALLGNAAHTVHPIAGQGFNLGVRDIAVLINEIKQAVALEKDFGGFEVLNQYQKNREGDIQRISAFTDSLVRLFGIEGRLPAFIRTVGLMSLQKFDPLQKWLALHFMGSQSAKNIPQLVQSNLRDKGEQRA